MTTFHAFPNFTTIQADFCRFPMMQRTNSLLAPRKIDNSSPTRLTLVVAYKTSGTPMGGHQDIALNVWMRFIVISLKMKLVTGH
jgi:hypothetical protein